MTSLQPSVDNDAPRPLLRRELFGADRPLPAFLEHAPEPQSLSGVLRSLQQEHNLTNQVVTSALQPQAAPCGTQDFPSTNRG